MTNKQGKGWFEEKDPRTGVATEHRAAALKGKSNISNAEVAPNETEAESIKKNIDAWNPEEDTVNELLELILKLKDTKDKDYDLSSLPVANDFKDFVDEHADYPIWTADYNGDILVGEAANEVENVNDFDDYYEAKFDFDVDQIKEIEEYIGAKMLDDEPYSNMRGEIYQFDDNSEWIIFKNEDEAESKAVEHVREMLNSEPETFTPSWLQDYITMNDTDRCMTADEEATNYAYEVIDEDKAMEEAGFNEKLNELQEDIDLLESEIGDLEEEKAELESTVEDVGDEDGKISDQITDIESDILSKMDEIHIKGKQQEALPDEAREKIQEDKYDEIYEELNDPVQYFVEDHGMYTLEDLMNSSLIVIDVDKAAQDAIDEDGIAHYLAGYDGKQVDLDNGMVMYRTN